MLATMSWTQWLLAVTIIGICLLLMLVILLQRGRGGGVAGAFGGGGGSGAFGAKTGDVFTWITVVVAAVFVGLAVFANYAFDESRLPTVAETTLPGTAEEGAPAETTKIFPIKMGEDGEMLPINLDSIEIKPTDAAPVEEKSSAPVEPADKPVSDPNGEKPADGDAAPTADESAKTGEEKPATP